MGRILTLLFCFMIATDALIAQSLGAKDLRYIHDDISIYLGNREKLIGGPGRNSEYLICLLDIDTAGKMSSMRVLGDSKNLDSTFFYLSTMPVNVLVKRIFNDCKGKTILLPVFSDTPKKVPTELKNISRSILPAKLEIVKEVGKLVYLTPLHYPTPTFVQ